MVHEFHSFFRTCAEGAVGDGIGLSVVLAVVAVPAVDAGAGPAFLIGHHHDGGIFYAFFGIARECFQGIFPYQVVIAFDSCGVCSERGREFGDVAGVDRSVGASVCGKDPFRGRGFDIVDVEPAFKCGERLDAEELLVCLPHDLLVCAVVEVFLDEAVSHQHKVEFAFPLLEGDNFTVPTIISEIPASAYPAGLDCQDVAVPSGQGCFF